MLEVVNTERVQMASMEKTSRAAEQVARATRGSYKTGLDYATAQQERNIRFFQGMVNSSVSEVRRQAESNRQMTQQLVEKAEAQRDAFQTLVEESVDAYMDLSYAPLSYYRQGLRLVVSETGESQSQNGGLPISNYDELNVADISKQLDNLSADEIQRVRDYEKQHKNRETLIEQFNRKLRAVS